MARKVTEVFWIEVVNWEKWNPRKDVKKPSWFRMENDLLDGNPEFDDFTSDELVTWWWMLSQCSRVQKGRVKISLEKWQRIRGIPIAIAWGAIEKLIDIGTINVTEASHPRDVDVTDATRSRDGGVENASHARNATNERTYERTNEDSPGEPDLKKEKIPSPTQLVKKGEKGHFGDKSGRSSDNSDAVRVIDNLIAMGSEVNARALIVQHGLTEQYRDWLGKNLGPAVEGGSA